MLNFGFLALYVLLSGLMSGAELFILLTVHFALLAIFHLKNKLPITPLFIFYLGVIIVNIANLSLIAQVDSRHITTYTYIVPKYIDQATLIWCVSSTLCVVGYQLVTKRSLPAIDVELKKKKSLQNLFWILFISNILTIVGFAIFTRGGNQFFKIFGLLNSIGILFYARLWAAEDNKLYRMYAILLYIVETYVALTTSYLRFELIVPTFYLFAGYFIGKGNLKFIFSYRIIPLVAILFFYSSVFSSLQHNRSNFITVFTGSDETAEAVEETKKDEGSGALLSRSANLAQITNVVNLVEKNGLYDGAASAPMITALVPRFLWPDKPLIQLGAWFALEIGAGTKTSLGTANNSINMTVAGQLYLDFGWLGVVLGSLLFGAFLAFLWNSTRFYSSEFNLTGTIFGGYLFLLSIGSYADLQVVITLLSTYLIFWLIKKIYKAV
jgi:hypothetical protein